MNDLENPETARRQISPEMVSAIRDGYKQGELGFRKLGRLFGVRSSTIQKIIRNQSYHDPNYKPPEREPLSQYHGWVVLKKD